MRAKFIYFKHFSNCIEKLHKMAFIIFFFFLKKLKKVEKIGYHSHFLVGNRECNTERGFKNQLYIELGVKGRGEKVGSYRVKWMLVRG